MYMNQLIDFTDFSENPIKHFLEEPIDFQIQTDRKHELTILLEDANTELFDEYFRFWNKNTEHFVQVENVKQTWYNQKSQGPRTLVSLKIRLDPRYVIYTRVADSILSGLEAVGGFYESLMHIGILFVFFF